MWFQGKYLTTSRFQSGESPESPKPPEFPKLAPKSREFTESPEVAPKEDTIMAYQGDTPKHIFDIVAQVTAALSQARVGAGATTQYVQNPYKADINPGTSDGLEMYLKVVEEKNRMRTGSNPPSQIRKRWLQSMEGKS